MTGKTADIERKSLTHRDTILIFSSNLYAQKMINRKITLIKRTHNNKHGEKYCYHCNGVSIFRWWRVKEGKKIIIIIVDGDRKAFAVRQRIFCISELHGKWQYTVRVESAKVHNFFYTLMHRIIR